MQTDLASPKPVAPFRKISPHLVLYDHVNNELQIYYTCVHNLVT